MASERTWAQIAFDRLVKEHVAPALKERGFRKRGLYWHVRRDEAPAGWGLINLQKSQWSHRDRISFTFNLAVRHDAQPGDADTAPLISDLDMFAPIRIGRLIVDARGHSIDLWWEVDGGQWSPGEGPDCLVPVLESLMPLLEGPAVDWVLEHLAKGPGYKRKLPGD